MKNKISLTFVAVFLVICMSTQAFATTISDSFGMTITGAYQAPKIEVVVPTTAEVVINPYRLPVAIGSAETDAQIMSSPACIQNKSEVPVSVSVTAIGAVKEGSDMRLSSVTTQGTTLTSKSAFIYFEMQPADSADPDDVYWDDGFDAKKHLIIRTTAKTMKNIVSLGMDGDYGCFGAFRLAGDCVANPRKPWTEDDGIDVTISFTFSPLARPDF